MDIVKQDIHSFLLAGEKCSELSIDEDFNISDAKGDIEKIIAKQGRAVIEDVYPDDGKVKITGTLYFQVIYQVSGENQDVEFFSSSIPYEDIINLESIVKLRKPEVSCLVEDISVEMINSRKLSIRALVENCVRVYEMNMQTVIGGLENASGVECLTENIIVTERPVCCQDVIHIKEELEIPQNKPNIEEILWSNVELRSMDYRAKVDGVKVSGVVEIFAIYKGQEEHLPLQYVYVARNISADVDCPGVDEDMISDIKCVLGKGDVMVRQDSDGEDRLIAIDFLANMTIRMYQEKSIAILKDVYSPQANMVLTGNPVRYNNIKLHNRAKTTISQRRRADNANGRLMQICHIYGDAVVDDFWYDEMLHISGIIRVSVLYVAAGNEPISCLQAVLPYEYEVELQDMPEGADYSNNTEIIPSVNDLTANMINGEEIDIKAEINLDITAFSDENEQMATDITVSPIDTEKKGAAPGLVGYVVGKDDTLWSIARKYYATTESIREINNLKSDDIKEGDRLLIMKS